MTRLVRAIACVAWCCAACREAPSRETARRALPDPETPPAATARLEIALPKAPKLGDELCAGRARCRTERQRSSAPPSKLEIVDLRIDHVPDAAADDDAAHCDRREYWLLGPPRPLLLAADCAEQWGPENPGPADTRLDGEELRLSYEELHESDVCETLRATLSLTRRRVVRQERRRGSYEKRECRRQVAIDPLPLGDGSAERPLLTLHQ